MNPSWHWVRVGYYLDRTSVYHRADMQRQTTIHAHKHTCGDSESPINLHVFRLEHLKETQAETERTCKLHTDKPGSNSEPSCCETAVPRILYCNTLQLVFPVKKTDLTTNIFEYQMTCEAQKPHSTTLLKTKEDKLSVVWSKVTSCKYAPLEKVTDDKEQAGRLERWPQISSWADWTRLQRQRVTRKENQDLKTKKHTWTLQDRNYYTQRR